MRYDLLLFVHVVGAILWVGLATTLALAGFRASRSPDPAESRLVGQLAGWLGPRVILPSALAVGVSGVLLARELYRPLEQLWLQIGLAAYIALLLGHFGFRLPQVGRVGRAIARHGPSSAQAVRHGRRLAVYNRIDLTLLFLLVGDMALRPTAADRALLAVGGGLLVVAVAGALVGEWRAPTRAPLADPGRADA